MWERSNVIVRRLHLRVPRGSGTRGGVADPGGGPVARLLQDADLYPPSMAPSAILLVRRLQRRFESSGPHVLREAWKAAVRAHIADAYERAQRPLRGDVPDAAESVLFEDPAEMTAALLWDVTVQRADRRWWWKSLLPGPDSVQHGASPVHLSRANLARLMVQESRYVPAAFTYLLAWRRAFDVVMALSPRQAWEVTSALCRVHKAGRSLQQFLGHANVRTLDTMREMSSDQPEPFALIETRRRTRDGLGDGESGRDRGSRGGGGSGQDGGGSGGYERGGDGSVDRRRSHGGRSDEQRRGGIGSVGLGVPDLNPGGDRRESGPVGPGEAGRVLAPWYDVVPESEAWPRGLGKERMALLGIGVTLARRPRALHNESFFESLARWWSTYSLDHLSQGSKGKHSSSEWEAADEVSRGVGGGAIVRTLRGTNSPTSHGAEDSEASGEASHAEPDASSNAAMDVRVSDHDPKEDERSRVRRDEPDAHPRRSPESGEDTRPSAQASVALVGDPWSGTPIATELAGVFYLIHVMRRLELPHAFEAQWKLHSALGMWGCLEVLARGLLAEDACSEDLIWPLLAELEGRGPDDVLGEGLARDATFTPPPSWIDWLARHGDDLFDGARRAGMQPFPCEKAVQGGVCHERQRLSQPLRRWMELAIPFVRYYISRSVEETGAGTVDPADLLRLNAQVFVTATHVDVVASMDDISMQARLAGLDADPGWDPLFGRVVFFHFR